MENAMDEMPHATVRYGTDDGVATVLLNRPESLNSMNNALMDDITAAFTRVDQDPEVGVVVLTGAGRGFCSGADLAAAAEPSAPQGAAQPPDDGSGVVASMDKHFNVAIRAIKDCRVPTIARVNGPAGGGGLGLALTCDIVIAAKSAFFVATFGPRLGIVPDLGTTWSLPARVGHARAMGMAMLGDRIPADQAEEWGLIWKSVPDGELDATVAQSAAVLKRTSGAAMQRIREAIDTAPNRTFSEQLDIERDHQQVLLPMNMAEGAAAFMEKRDPNFES